MPNTHKETVLQQMIIRDTNHRVMVKDLHANDGRVLCDVLCAHVQCHALEHECLVPRRAQRLSYDLRLFAVVS